MNAAKILSFPEHTLRNASKKELIQMVLSLRADFDRMRTESDLKIAALQEKLDKQAVEIERLTRSNINKIVNQPSSKLIKLPMLLRKRKNEKNLTREEKVRGTTPNLNQK